MSENGNSFQDPIKRSYGGYVHWTSITQEMVDEIARMISEGIPRHEASHQMGTSNTQLYRYERRHPEAAQQLYEAAQEGREAYKDHIRSDMWFHAFVEKNYKALQTLGIAELPEFEHMRSTRLEIGNVDGESFKMAAIKALGPDVSKETLKALMDMFERSKELEKQGISTQQNK